VNAAGFTTHNVESFFGIFKRGMRGLTASAVRSTCGANSLSAMVIQPNPIAL
jgi:hypothetical protein